MYLALQSYWFDAALLMSLYLLYLMGGGLCIFEDEIDQTIGRTRVGSKNTDALVESPDRAHHYEGANDDRCLLQGVMFDLQTPMSVEYLL